MQNCRFCKDPLQFEFIDLANAPPSNAFLTAEELFEPETYYPLKLFVCSNCFLVQINEYKMASEIFDSQYVYFSSFSKTWLEHCKQYVDKTIERFSLPLSTKITEIASNDGYLLQFFHQKGYSTLGIEPTANTAKIAIQKGIETEVRFFGDECAKELVEEKGKSDLIIANNVLAHVPDINDFVKGLKIFLSDSGMVTAEFPHLLALVKLRQFDTIYHEHFSYFSFFTIFKIFKAHGLHIFDVEELNTHGGSLRIYADHGTAHEVSPSVDALIQKEMEEKITNLDFYRNFQATADELKNQFLTFLLEAKKTGKSVAAYGAAAKGNTFLNYCGIKSDLISFVVDASPHKQGKFLPGSHIPVVSESSIRDHKPNYVVILPWNLKSEIMAQLSYIKAWDGKFVVAVPHLETV